MIRRLVILSCLFLFVSVAVAQEKYKEQIQFKDLSIERLGDKVGVAVNVNVSQLMLGRDHAVIITPIIRSNQTGDAYEMKSLLVNGSRKQKFYDRAVVTGDLKSFGVPKDLIAVKRLNNSEQQISYYERAPLQGWMEDASLEVKETVIGCASCGILTDVLPLKDHLFPMYIEPKYELTYIVPEAETIKRRTERFSASFGYVVNRTELRADFGDNAKEFARVDKLVKDLKDDKNITVTDIVIDGYASPEGGYKHNVYLSKGRAESFASYLTGAHALDKKMFVVNWHSEDWDGLKKAVEASSFDNKEEILAIINSNVEPDPREAKLKKLKVYTTLLRDIYPSLRRNDCAIGYTVRAFNLEEARSIIKAKPQQLSLNEMYLVAQSYGVDTPEFREVFDVAVRMFPQESVAIINASAADIESGNVQVALNRLVKINENPKAWNNLGVAYARERDWASAKKYLNRAIAQGDASARHNLEEVNKQEAQEAKGIRKN